jgi:predicted nucleotidyltransferase
MGRIINKEILNPVIQQIVEDFDPTKIVHFGSSLNSEFYDDIDLAIEIEIAGKRKNDYYQNKLSKEFKMKLDLTFISDFEQFKQELNITNYKLIEELKNG